MSVKRVHSAINNVNYRLDYECHATFHTGGLAVNFGRVGCAQLDIEDSGVNAEQIITAKSDQIIVRCNINAKVGVCCLAVDNGTPNSAINGRL